MNVNDARNHQILNQLYIQCCADLLNAHGLTVHIREQSAGAASQNRTSYMSVLGATGLGISLSSVLKIDQELVATIHPLRPSDVSPSDLEDWCRELNNQLVGRLKNKLLGYGRTVSAGLPVLITGTDVRPVPAHNSEVHEYSVESAHGQIILTLATLVTEDIELPEEGASSCDEVLSEGTLALF